jgi:type I restriction enzyme M protein
MAETTTDIVAKLWNLCHVLRDDGITYHQYVSELTYLLFLKMAKETETEKQLPKGYRWADLENKEGVDQLNFYRELLLHLGTKGSDRVLAIFANATTALKVPKNLKKLVDAIDDLDWYSAKTEGLGDLYEGLLEKNASEKKSGAGQYFTPRPLIDSMVHLVKPKAGELMQDPAAGTGGFLIAADRYIKARRTTSRTSPASSRTSRSGTRTRRGAGAGHPPPRADEPDAPRHRGAHRDGRHDDARGRGARGRRRDPHEPPVRTKKGGGQPTRDDFTFRTSNKQLNFVQHIYRNLPPGGRAAVVLPDNVLFEENVGADIRRDLMDKTDLHTILRLPTGIFYAQGVKTNVLFFTKGDKAKDKNNTKATWIYDMRANMPSFGKRTPFTREAFAEFEKAFGSDPYGKCKRKDTGEEGRFRKFTREDIKARGDNLDIAWLKDESAQDPDDLPEPGDIADEIMENLRVAMTEMEALRRELGVGG